jgi:tetratricopeptide (TPR) repeat protein
MYRIFLISALLVNLYSCGSKTDADKLRFLEKGNSAFGNNDMSEAIRFYEEALAKDSSFVDAWNNKGLALMRQTNYDEAIYCFNQALHYKPDYAEALLNNARANLAVHQYFAAFDLLDELSAIWPDTSIIYFTKGLIHADMAEPRQALADFRHALSLDSLNAEVWVNIANIYYHQQLPDSAILNIKKALILEPGQPQAYNILAMVYAYQEQYKDALKAINTAISFNRHDAYFVNNKGFILLKMDSLEQAEENIIQSMKMDPYNGWVYRNLGLLRYARGNITEASRLLEKAMKIDDKIDHIYPDLARTYSDMGDIDKACALLLTAPKDTETASLISKLCKSEGKNGT